MSCLNGKTKKAGGPNVTFPQLATDGATLLVFDKGGNPITTVPPVDPAKTTITWASSDDTVIVVHVHDASKPDVAELHSTGKVGTDVTVTATFTNLDGSPPMDPAVSDGIDVPAGPPAKATIILGVPA